MRLAEQGAAICRFQRAALRAAPAAIPVRTGCTALLADSTALRRHYTGLPADRGGVVAAALRYKWAAASDGGTALRFERAPRRSGVTALRHERTALHCRWAAPHFKWTAVR